MARDILIPMNDSLNLKARVFEAPNAQSILIVGNAMAVPAKIYESLAQHLSSKGVDVVLFDYRGVASNQSMVKDSRIEDWANDIGKVIEYFRARYAKIHYLGHSLGGQILGMIPNHQVFNKVAFMCTSTGVWWRNKHLPTLLQAGFVMNFYIPLSNLLFGHANAEIIGMGKNLPKSASNEWAKWCRSPGYFSDFRQYYKIYDHENIEREILNVLMYDDPIANQDANRHLKSLFPKVQFTDVVVKDSKPIGHLGFTHPKNQNHWSIFEQWFV